MKIFFSLIFFLLSTTLFAQIYHPVLKTYLDNLVDETSGLLLHNGKLWTHNDSGGDAALYNIDTTNGTVKKIKYIKNATNRDWEDICNDDKYAYIGDIGNNSGKFQDFVIYRILLSDLDSELCDSIEHDKIIFKYNSEYYKPNPNTPIEYNKTNFDSEAMIVKGDSIYIFSKNWVDKKCYFYSISKIPGEYTANIRDTLDANGLICGADYNEQTNTLALIGYVYGIPVPSILILITNFDEDNFFNGTIMRKELKLKGYQTEGVVFIQDYNILISNETFLNRKQALRNISLKSQKYSDFYISYNEENSNIEFVLPLAGRYKIHITDANGEIIKKIKKKKYSKGVNIVNIKSQEYERCMINIFNSKINFCKKNASLTLGKHTKNAFPMEN
jgi:hypothetical protein